MITTIMILVNGDLLLIILTIHGARVPNQHHGVLVESRARAVVDQVRVESLDGGQVMMITGLVMDGIRRVASQPIIVPKVASRLITRLPQSCPSHRHIPSPNILGNPIPSRGHLNQDPVVEVERSPRSGNH